MIHLGVQDALLKRLLRIADETVGIEAGHCGNWSPVSPLHSDRVAMLTRASLTDSETRQGTAFYSNDC
jgi:hypothetical protein